MNKRLLGFLRVIWALFVARTKEYYRDRGAMIWSFLFPICIVAAIGFAFSEESQELFRVGLYQPEGAAALQHGLLDEPYITVIPYADFEQALERVRFHQLDLLISSAAPGAYWINELSARGRAVEQIYLAQQYGLSQGSAASNESAVSDARPQGVQEQPRTQRQIVSGKRVRYVDWVIPGVLGMNIMFGALFGVGYVIVRYRKNGVLKRLQVTPVTRLQFLTAQILSRLIVLLVSVAIVYMGCNYFLNFVMLGSYLNLLSVVTLGSFAMVALSLIFCSRTASEELAGGLINFVAFPMMLLSEVWFSLDNAPQWLVGISQLLPLTHMVQGARAIMIDGAGFTAISHHLWIMAAMSVVFLVLASVLFRWNER